MKRQLMVWALALVFVFGLPLAVFAADTEARDSGAVPFMNDKGEVVIQLPAGAKLVNVEVYDDLRGIPRVSFGAQSVVPLQVGAGFNYQWSDASGTSWQLITESSKVGPGIEKDCTWKDKQGIARCKYVRVQ